MTTPKIHDSSSNHTYNITVSELVTNRNISLPLLSNDDIFVFENHSQTLSNKTLTSPKINDSSTDHTYNIIVSELSANRSVTLPLLSNDDIFVFEKHNQVLTNKTLTASSTYFQDNVDNTKKFQFELSGISSSTTRTLTIPNGNTILVGTDTNQTLTNKTMDFDNNTVTNIDNSNIKSGASINATKIADGSISNTEFQQLNGITSSVVSISDVQTLTNKTLTDSSTYFQDNGDNSKKFQFELSDISTSTTRILTVPNGNTIIVGTNISQTLTNKTIDGDLNTLSNIDNDNIKSNAGISADKIANGSVSNTEFQQLSAIGSAVVGVSDTQTLTNKTLTSPKIETAINDANGNELIKLSSVGSAVNEITIGNNRTGNSPSISATGNNTNIDLNISSKGSGNVIIDNIVFPNSDGTSGQVLKSDGDGTLSFADAAILDTNTVTTTDATTTTLITSSTSSGNVYLIEASIVGRRTDSGSEGGGYIVRGFFRNDSGTLTKIGDDYIYASDYKWIVQVGISGEDIIVQVIGESGKTINWKSTSRVISVG
jgi:hypothetical protein